MSHLAHLLDTKNGHGSYLHQNFILWYFQIVVTIIDDCDNVQFLQYIGCLEGKLSCAIKYFWMFLWYLNDS